MILVPYFLVAAYTLKLAIKTKNRGMLLFIGSGATIYGIWLLYASGLSHLLLASLLYLPGLYFFIKAKKELNQPYFVGKERIFVVLLILLSIFAIYMVATGHIVLES